jgi:maltose-binding protein MalE
MEAVVPGYKVDVKAFASYDALGAAWDKATSATGPDIILRDGALAVAGAKSGRIQSLLVSPATRAQFAPAAWSAMTVNNRVYGIPTDVDTTAMIYNTAMFASAPKTIGEIYDYYIKNKATLTNGVTRRALQIYLQSSLTLLNSKLMQRSSWSVPMVRQMASSHTMVATQHSRLARLQ